MKVRDISIMAVLLAILVVCSKISIHIGPVPLTLQTFAVFLIAYLMKWKKASIIFLTYIVMGLVGIPVFSGPDAGYMYVLKPSFGFIIGFMVVGLICGSPIFDKKKPLKLVLGYTSLVVLYVVGIIYMTVILNLYMDKGMGFSQIMIAGIGTGGVFLIKDVVVVPFTCVIADRLEYVVTRYYENKGLAGEKNS